MDEAPQGMRRFHSTILYSLIMRLTLNMSTHEHPKFKATIWSTYGGSMVDGALGGLWWSCVDGGVRDYYDRD